MRTSRVSRETAVITQALSPPRRQTRSIAASDRLSSFAFSSNSAVKPASAIPLASTNIKQEADDSDGGSSLSSANTADIEDLLTEPSRKRKRNGATSTSRRSPRKIVVQGERLETTAVANGSKLRKLPARKTKDEDGRTHVEPPSNWDTIYSLVKDMRARNPTAPVDTMGCAELYWRASSPRDRRFQTLVALMLSSQTKDTVTAVAMQRLHTELVDEPAGASPSPIIKKEEEGNGEKDAKPTVDSKLNLENMLAVSPTHLNELIRTVGFHNNKTKYIKAAAEILRDEYNSDIPPTATELMRLPGVGPKMAYLCMSAAWGRDEGIGVDVHVHRITNLWGWHKTKNPEETRMALESWLPRDKWHEINKLLVGLGQTACLPVGRRCGECDLAGKKLCKSEIKGWVAKETRRSVKTSPKKEEASVEIKTESL